MIADMLSVNHNIIFGGVCALIVLQIATVVMLQKVFAAQTKKLLASVFERDTTTALAEIRKAVTESTKAALDAYREANTVNEKIARLNERLEELTAPRQTP